MYPEANVMSLSNETNPVHFPPQDRRTTLYSILPEKLRDKTGTNWNLLRPLSDDLYRFHSQAQIEVRTDDVSGTISIHPLDTTREWKMWITLSHRRMIRKYFWADAASDSMRRHMANMVYGLSDDMPARMMLVFDAEPFDNRALPHVVKSFKKRHGTWARQIGLHGIWLVGSPDNSCRLDSD